MKKIIIYFCLVGVVLADYPEKIHLKCNDNAASTAVSDNGDFSQSITASVNTDTMSASGKIGNAFSFNGTSSRYLLGGYDSTLDTGIGTVCLWFKPASIGENSLIAFGANTGSRYDWNMRANCGGNELWGELGGIGGNVRASGVPYSTSAWIHLAVVQNGSSAVVYTNGVLSTSMDNR